jgi:hypothetical protein
MEQGQQLWQGPIIPWRNGKARQVHPGNLGPTLCGQRQAPRIVGGKVDDKTDCCEMLVIKAPDAKAAHFNQAGEFVRRAREKAPVMRFEHDAVVGDKPRKRKVSGLRGCDEIQRQP